ncbi:MAG: hypothetical protein KDC54_05610 [Lewinella sp.]|nr:hypothetical protein [Lewinella sp.]
MYYRLSFLLLAITLMGCNSSSTNSSEEAHIRTLSTEWNDVTRQLGEMGGSISQEARHWQGIYDIMNVDSTALNELSPADREEALTLQAECARHGVLYRNLMEEISDFFNRWEAAGRKVTDLNEALVNNTLTARSRDMLNDAQVELDQARAQLANWRSRFNQIKDECTDGFNRFAELTAE